MNIIVLIWFHGRSYPDYHAYKPLYPDSFYRLFYDLQLDLTKVAKVEVFPAKEGK